MKPLLSRLRLPVYPTPRLALAFAAGSALFFAIPWLGVGFLWLGIGYIISLISLAIIDSYRLREARECVVARHCESALSIGAQYPIPIEVDNPGSIPLRVVVRDESPLEFVSSSRFLTFDVPAGAKVASNYKVLPPERGDYRFGALNVRITTNLRLVMIQTRIPAEFQVKVYPDVLQTKKHLILLKENRVAQMGIRRSRIYGQGQEFERLRDYIPDDSLRHVDWKATARRGILTTREYNVERSQQIMILVDIGRSMASRTVEHDGTPGISKADCAINAAVLLSHVAAGSDDRVGLFCFARDPVVYVPPGKGLPQAERLLDALYPLQPRVEEPSYYNNFLLFTQKQKKRSLVFLFTDLIDPIASHNLISGIGLLTQKHLVVCAALSDYELPQIIDADPETPSDLYTQVVALNIVGERRKALANLSSQGVITIDAAPSDLSVATVNEYLRLKREARL